MKQIIFISTLLIFLSTKMFAQDAKTKLTPEERARFQTGWMKENLNLDESQLTQVESLNLKFAQKMEEVKNIQGRLGKVREAKSNMDEKDKQLKKILTKDQFKIYKEKQEELREKLKQAAQERRNN